MIGFPVSRHDTAGILPDGMETQGICGHPRYQDPERGGCDTIETHELLCHSMNILFFLMALQFQYISFRIVRMWLQSRQRPKTRKPI